MPNLINLKCPALLIKFLGLSRFLLGAVLADLGKNQDADVVLCKTFVNPQFNFKCEIINTIERFLELWGEY